MRKKRVMQESFLPESSESSQFILNPKSFDASPSFLRGGGAVWSSRPVSLREITYWLIPLTNDQLIVDIATNSGEYRLEVGCGVRRTVSVDDGRCWALD